MTDAAATLAKLPPRCLAILPADGSAIIIERGVSGYYPFPGKTAEDVAAYNARHGITAAQVFAMEIGSAFGWDCPGADPDTH